MCPRHMIFIFSTLFHLFGRSLEDHIIILISKNMSDMDINISTKVKESEQNRSYLPKIRKNRPLVKLANHTRYTL
ncbi:hypothetical protein V6Z11_D05G340100 [Gossypium hirsutum]